MYQEERLQAILTYLHEHKRIRVEEICERFGVSRDTARRDLVKLEEQQRIVRTHGGAILPFLTKDITFYDERAKTGTQQKQLIGQAAVELIQDGDYLFMNASTTVEFAARSLKTKENVIVTNSIDIADVLSYRTDVMVHLLGGRLHPRQRFVYGSKAIEMLADYQVDKLLLGTCGITPEGLTNPYEEEGHMLRAMIQHADQVIVLADHTKFGKRMFFKVAPLHDIDVLVTDREPEQELAQILNQSGVDIVVVPSLD
jgi:DeoR family transcriptional regulator, carbon catabolite repression regulator